MREEIDRFLDAIRLERRFSHNTVVAYRSDLNQFVAYLEEGCAVEEDPSLGDRSGSDRSGVWQELTEGRLNDYLRTLHDRPYATSTVARKTAAIKSFFQFLYRAGLMGEDPSLRWCRHGSTSTRLGRSPQARLTGCWNNHAESAVIGHCGPRRCVIAPCSKRSTRRECA
jgi:site-specific recombinase XerD